MADDALQHVGRVGISFIVHRIDLDSRTILPLLIENLTLARGQNIDREAWLPLLHATLLNLLIPLVASSEPEIIKGERAQVFFRLFAKREALLRFF